VIPVHFNTWPLIEQDPHSWAARVEEETETKAHVLKPGESISF
jgi:L-ascorbate metabolism protein UlaG (beta-lactamase superfamily)